MYTICLGLLIGAAIGFSFSYFSKSGNARLGDRVCNIVMFVLVGGMIGAVLAVNIIRDMVPTHEEVSDPVTMVAMRSSAGTFVWGSGSVSSELTYNFYIRHPDGSLSPGHVTASNLVQIIEDTNLHDVGYWRTYTVRHDADSPLAPWALFRSGSGTVEKEEFRVPVGTVVQNFDVK